MKNIILLTFLSLLFFKNEAYSQINIADSTVQVLGYWDKHEKETYIITEYDIKIKNNDTIKNEYLKCEAIVTIIDSTANSYTIKWDYQNFSTNSENEIYKKIINLSEDMEVYIKTDENGKFIEVVNWLEIVDYIKRTTNKFLEDYKDQEPIQNVITSLLAKYDSKQSIETYTILEILQFHYYHGLKFQMGEVLESEAKFPSPYTKEPLNGYVEYYLDEINNEENYYIIRSYQEVDKEELHAATKNYLVNILKAGFKEEAKELTTKDLGDIGDFTNEVYYFHQMHGTGWPIYTVFTNVTKSKEVMVVKKRIVEIKTEE